MSPNDLKSAVDVMLRVAQLDGEIDSLEILNGGKNNQTYKLILRDGNRYVVKKYFQHAEDPRDRQNSEFLFSAYASKVCPGHVAKVYCRDRSIKATLFEFINGEPIVPGSIGTAEINCAINFINTFVAVAKINNLNIIQIIILPDARYLAITANYTCYIFNNIFKRTF